MKRVCCICNTPLLFAIFLIIRYNIYINYKRNPLVKTFPKVYNGKMKGLSVPFEEKRNDTLEEKL